MSEYNAEKRDTIVLGASAGGIEALNRLLPAFESDLEASVFVVLHLPADGRSLLDELLARSTPLKTAFARDNEAIVPRRIYIAPPDRHLLVMDGHVKLWPGPRENHSRPSIDPLFRSAAVARRGRVIGAVLSGMLDDGVAGLLSVKRCGGLAFVQAPHDAVEAEMPNHAADALGDSLDGALPAHSLGTHIAGLIGSAAPPGEVPHEVELEMQMLLDQVPGLDALSGNGPPIPLSCPECGGPLWSIRDGRLQRYRCHTGHAFGVESFLASQNRQIEQAMWAAIKGLEQRSKVLQNLAREETQRGRAGGARGFVEEAKRLVEHAHTLRNVLIATLQAAQDHSTLEDPSGSN